MFPYRSIRRKGTPLDQARNFGFGDPVFFLDGNRFDHQQGLWEDEVSGLVGVSSGSVVADAGENGPCVKFANGHVDFGPVDLFSPDVNGILLCARILVTDGYSSTRMLVGQDENATNKRHWAFGLSSTNYYYHTILLNGVYSSYTYNAAQQSGIPRGKWVTYVISVASEDGWGDVTKVFAPFRINTSIYTSCAPSLASSTKLTVGAILSAGARTSPFYGSVQWLGLWNYVPKDWLEIRKFARQEGWRSGARVLGARAFAAPAKRIFYVNSEWWNGPEAASIPEVSNASEISSVPGSLFRTKYTNVLFRVVSLQNVNSSYTPENINLATPLPDHGCAAQPRVAGYPYEGLQLFYQLVSGLSPEYPAYDVQTLSTLLSPGDTVRLFGSPEATYGGYLSIGKNSTDNVNHQPRSGYRPGRWPPIVIEGTNTPEGSGVLELNRAQGATAYAAPELRIAGGLFVFKNVQNGGQLLMEFSRSWVNNVSLGHGTLSVKEGIACGKGVVIGAPAVLSTITTYPTLISANDISEFNSSGTSPVSHTSIWRGSLSLHDSSFSGQRPAVHAGDGKLRLAHSRIRRPLGSEDYASVCRESAPAGNVVDLFAVDIDRCALPVHCHSSNANVSKARAAVLIRRSSVREMHAGHSGGTSFDYFVPTTDFYRIASIPLLVEPFSFRHDNWDRLLFRTGDPRDLIASMEWVYSHKAIRGSSVSFEINFISPTSRDIYNEPEGFLWGSVSYYDTEGSYTIVRDQNILTSDTSCPVAYTLTPVASADWVHGGYASEDVKAGKRVITVPNVGNGLMRVRLRVSFGYLTTYIDPIIGVTVNG